MSHNKARIQYSVVQCSTVNENKPSFRHSLYYHKTAISSRSGKLRNTQNLLMKTSDT